MKTCNIDQLEKLSHKPSEKPKSQRNKRILEESIKQQLNQVDCCKKYGCSKTDSLLGL